MESFDKYLADIGEVGYITSINQSLIEVRGLPEVRLGELVVTENGKRGNVQTIQADFIRVMMFEVEDLACGMRVVRTGQPLRFAARESLLGRIVDPLSRPIDGGGPVEGEIDWRPVETEAPGIDRRVKISKALETGVTIVDQMVSLGKGQKELVLGDQKTGKTTFCLQALASQVKEGTLGIYVSCGKKKSDIKFVQDYLKRVGVFEKTSIIVASSSDPPPLVFLAPFSGMALAEYFRDKGKDVLLVLDDLSHHAKYYREIALLAKRTPGRNSYPADIFHLHGRLLERTGNIKIGNSEAAITTLPIAETVEGEIIGYIQTNLMAITDGHIYFDAEELKRGNMPAVNVLRSVSRVGFQTRKEFEKQMTLELRKKLVAHVEAEEIARFGVEFVEQLKADIDFGLKLKTLFSQDTDEIITREAQLLLLSLLFSGFWQNQTEGQIRSDKEKILSSVNYGELKSVISQIEQVKNFQEILLQANNIREEVARKIHGQLSET